MKVEKRGQLREGKAKILFETDQPQRYLIQYFKDDATAFNALKKDTIQDKGTVNNTVSTWIFQHLTKHGVPTHFVEKLSAREMLVRTVDIIPVEVVVRNRAAGSILKKLGLEKGQPFNPPLVEFFYKSDSLGDPPIGETHILQFGWATRPEIEAMTKLSLEVNGILKDLFGRCGLELIDFKLEFGKEREGGRLVLADEFSPDGCRLWDKTTGESKDKDRFRQDLGGVREAYLEVQERLARVLEAK
ncbi:phosphoribosylaminoimidazolesuccinocarboxamide synthase [bacterium]|nr:phosphoribosylaminoimidazolesuccinocarboxamide synthase [bacterium]